VCHDTPVAVVVVRYSERPQLWERIQDLSADVWPEYNRHGDILGPCWDRLYDEFPDFQFVLYDELDEVLAVGHTIPVAWDGSIGGLGPSWTALAYPESGDYVFPHGLAPLHVDRDAAVGTYWEPNVWVVHTEPGPD
jgi:hypothetical protein